MKFLAELRRRNVIRVAGLYLVTAWLLIQIAETLLPIFHTPDWVLQALVVLLALGFLPALIVSWVFELTPEGLKRDSEVASRERAADNTARKLDIVVIVLLLLVSGLFLWGQRRGGHEGSPAAPTEAPASAATTSSAAMLQPEGAQPAMARTVAVLPFDNLSSDPEQGYFADGLTEEILNALASVSGLMVTARTSSFHFKDKDVPVDEVGQRLGVEHILEGSVRRSGDQLRVTAQLVRAHDGFQVWSQVYDRALNDAFSVQGDIAAQVATALGILLDDAQRVRMNTSGARSPEAYALFARGYELYRAAHNDSPQIPTLVEANRLFDQAVENAPQLWAAHYHSADLYAHIVLAIAGGIDPGALPAEEVVRANEELHARLSRASATAPNDAARDYIQLTQQLLSDDWRGIGPLVRRAYSHSEACGYDQWMQVGVPLGLAREALVRFRRGMQCNALDDSNWGLAAHAAIYSGDSEEAIQILERALAMQELSRGWARLQANKVVALLALGRLDDARAESLRGKQSGQEAEQTTLRLAAANGDAEHVKAVLAGLQPARWSSSRELEYAAIAGDRATANRLAAEIDARPSGPLVLLVKTYFCLCGAPFDIEYAPTLAERLEQAELPWPPTAPIKWPLKDW